MLKTVSISDARFMFASGAAFCGAFALNSCFCSLSLLFSRT